MFLGGENYTYRQPACVLSMSRPDGQLIKGGTLKGHGLNFFFLKKKVHIIIHYYK